MASSYRKPRISRYDIGWKITYQNGQWVVVNAFDDACHLATLTLRING
jgi:hypothetical protein